jgi:hypothetical protein
MGVVTVQLEILIPIDTSLAALGVSVSAAALTPGGVPRELVAVGGRVG